MGDLRNPSISVHFTTNDPEIMVQGYNSVEDSFETNWLNIRFGSLTMSLFFPTHEGVKNTIEGLKKGFIKS